MEGFYFLRGLKTAALGIVLLVVFLIWFGLSTIGGEGNAIAALLLVGALAISVIGPLWYWLGSPLWAALTRSKDESATDGIDEPATK